jgi:hypothetical protein
LKGKGAGNINRNVSGYVEEIDPKTATIGAQKRVLTAGFRISGVVQRYGKKGFNLISALF